jgi:hypothetical protein
MKFRSPIYSKKTLNPITVKELIDTANRFYKLSDVLNSIGLTSNSQYDTKTITGQAKAYALCPVVSSIINARANAGNMGKWVLEDPDGNPLGKTRFDKLFRRPNPLQNWKQFYNNASIFKDIFGRCYILPIKPDFSKDPLSAGAMWILPNWLVTPSYTGQIWLQSEITGIIKDYSVQGLPTPLKPEELIIWDDTGVNTTQNTNELVTFQSRLYSLSDQISNLQRSYEARRKILTKGGPPGAWVNTNAKDAGGMNPKTPKQIKELHDALEGQHGLGDDTEYLNAVLSSAWDFIKAGSPIADLELSDGEKDMAMVIGFAFNLPETMLPWSISKTFDNVKIDEKKFYNNAIIPANEDFSQVIMDWFGLENLNIYLRCYFDHLDCFQTDKKAEADTFNAYSTAIDKSLRNTLLSKEEGRRILGTLIPVEANFKPDEINPKDTFLELQQPVNTPTNGNTGA